MTKSNFALDEVEEKSSNHMHVQYQVKILIWQNDLFKRIIGYNIVA